MAYTYKDFPDKSIEGIEKEMGKGLAKIAAFMYRTHGMPFDFFQNQCNKHNRAELLLMYLDFRNKHPELWGGLVK